MSPLLAHHVPPEREVPLIHEMEALQPGGSPRSPIIDSAQSNSLYIIENPREERAGALRRHSARRIEDERDVVVVIAVLGAEKLVCRDEINLLLPIDGD